MQAWCAEVLIVRVFITACQSSVCAYISSFMRSSLLNTINTMKLNDDCLVTIILHYRSSEELDILSGNFTYCYC